MTNNHKDSDASSGEEDFIIRRKSKKAIVESDEDISYDEQNNAASQNMQNCEKHNLQVKTDSNLDRISFLFKDKDLYEAESSDEEIENCEEKRKNDSFEQLGDLVEVEDSASVFPKTLENGRFPQQKLEKKQKTARNGQPRKAKSAAVAEINNIRSETQRMIRESCLSLPYHRPKQHSIKEFLQRRKSLQSNIKEITMSNKHLGLVWKELEERKKEAEEFYKSDSEGSDDDFSETVSIQKEEASVIEQGKIIENTASETKYIDVSEKSENILHLIQDNTDLLSDVSKPNVPVTPEEEKEDSLIVENESLCPVLPVVISDKSINAEKMNEPSFILESDEAKDDCSIQKTVVSGEYDVVNVSTECKSIKKNHFPSTEECIPKAVVSDVCRNTNQISYGKVEREVIPNAVYDDNAFDPAECNTEDVVATYNVGDIESQDLVLHYTVNDSLGLDTKNISPQSELNTSFEGSLFEKPTLAETFSVEDSVKSSNKAENLDCNVPNNESIYNSKSVVSILRDTVPIDTMKKKLQDSVIINCISMSSDNAVTVPGEKDLLCDFVETNCKEEESTMNGNVSKMDIDVINYSEKKSCNVNSVPITNKSGDTCENITGHEDKLGAIDTSHKIISKSLDRLRKLPNITPQLKGHPDDLIDLDVDTPTKQSGVDDLIKRFMRHSSVKKDVASNKKLEVSVSSIEKNSDGAESVIHEVIFLPADDSEPEDPKLAKPGAKLLRLKEELHHQIARQREEEWIKKQQEFKIDNEEEFDDEKSECGMLSGGEEPQSETETETEPEEEENLAVVNQKRPRNAFVDDEAEVSDDSEYEGDEEDDDDDENSVDNDNSDTGNSSESISEGKDHSSDLLEEKTGNKSDSNKTSKLRRVMTLDMFESEESNCEDGGGDVADTSTVSALNIPPYQPGGAVTQISQATQEKGNVASPIFKIPVPEELCNNEVQTSQVPYTCSLSPESSFFRNGSASSIEGACKKLFSAAKFGSEENMQELMDCCSGKFSGFDGKTASPASLLEPDDNPRQSVIETELIGLCSGDFSSQPVNIKGLEGEEERKDSGMFTQDSQKIEDTQELKSPSKFSRSSPPLTSKFFKLSDVVEKNKSFQMEIVSTDEEDCIKTDKISTQRKKKRSKKLEFSDEEADSDHGSSSDESDSETATSKAADYDSEENEIFEYHSMSAKRDYAKTAKEFFDNEAELSESEWGSEDEDERDLDKLDWEEGDAEQVNEKKLKEQLGKIHMRQVLDDDQREVRMLQELLLEDGELHSDGAGRERKFRWKNINIADNVDQTKRDSDLEDNCEPEGNEEDEEEWRKERFQRESFLMEHKEKAASAGKDDDGLVEDDSQLLKLGKAALKRMRCSNSQDLLDTTNFVKKAVSEVQISPNAKHPFKLLTKRGSFLARGETALARIAQITDITRVTAAVSAPRNTRNFVFATLSPEKALETCETKTVVKIQKRKTIEQTPPMMKRLKFEEKKMKCLFDQLDV